MKLPIRALRQTAKHAKTVLNDSFKITTLKFKKTRPKNMLPTQSKPCRHSYNVIMAYRFHLLLLCFKIAMSYDLSTVTLNPHGPRIVVRDHLYTKNTIYIWNCYSRNLVSLPRTNKEAATPILFKYSLLLSLL